MFGISMPEITVILIIAIIVLGPEKLPKVLVELAKYFKVIKKTINDAKSSFDQELRIFASPSSKRTPKNIKRVSRKQARACAKSSRLRSSTR